MKKAILIVAQKDFQPVEYGDTRAELEKAGIEVKVASLEKGEAVGNDGNKINVDLSINEISSDDFDAIVIIGGPGAREQLVENPELLKLIEDTDHKRKIVAAICIAPVALANSKILAGRRVTAWNGDGKQMKSMTLLGANFVDTEDVVVDGRLITANGPSAAKKFGQTIAKVLG